MVDFKVARVRRNVNGETGTIDFTVSGFGTVKAAIVMAGYGTTADDTLTQHAGHSLAFTDGSTHLCMSNRLRDAVDPNAVVWTTRGTFNDGVGAGTLVNLFNRTAQTEAVELKFDSFITDGLRLSAAAANAVAAVTDCAVEVWLLGGADLSVDVLQPQEPTGVAAVNITGLAFQPTAIVFGWTGSTLQSSGQANSGSTIGVGFAADSESGIQQCSACMSADGSDDPSIVRHVMQDFAAIQYQAETSAASGLAARITSFNSDGWTWVRDLTLGSANNNGPMALALRVESAFTYTAIEDTGTGSTKSVTAPGFSPIFGMILPTRRSTTDSRVEDDTAGLMSIGVFSKTEEASLAVTAQDAVATTQTTTNFATEAYRAPLHDGTFGTGAHQGSITATSQGFDIAFSQHDATTARFFAYLVIGAPTVASVDEELNISEEVHGVIGLNVAIEDTLTIEEQTVHGVVRASTFADFAAQAGHVPAEESQAGHMPAEEAQAGYDEVVP